MVEKCGSIEHRRNSKSLETSIQNQDLMLVITLSCPFVSITNCSFPSLPVSLLRSLAYLSLLLLQPHSFLWTFSPPFSPPFFLPLRCCIHGKRPQILLIFITLSWEMWLYRKDDSPVISIWIHMHLCFLSSIPAEIQAGSQLFILLQQ